MTTSRCTPPWSPTRRGRGRVIPTFRPDRYLEASEPGWPEPSPGSARSRASTRAPTRAGSARWKARRRHFIEHGARSADHAHTDAGTEPLEPTEVDRIYRAALGGTASPSEAVALRRHMLLEMARMSTEDGLTMTLHIGVRARSPWPVECQVRTRTPATTSRCAATSPTRCARCSRGSARTPTCSWCSSRSTRPSFSRELAPLAGFYPSVYIGAPWWFLDAPDAVRRWRSAVTDTAGFSRTSGFIDDTRAFCSIPARHDMSRRLDSGHLAQLVAEHRIDEDEAQRQRSTW